MWTTAVAHDSGIPLLSVSIWIRLRLAESPIFQKMKDEDALCKAPIREAFGDWTNAKIALIALFGLTAGEAVIWYGGQFYARIFLVSTLKVPANAADSCQALSSSMLTPCPRKTPVNFATMPG